MNKPASIKSSGSQSITPLQSFKEYLATTPAVELLNDYTYLLLYVNHDPYDEQERYQHLVDAVATVGTKFTQVDTWRAGCAKRERDDPEGFWTSAMRWHDQRDARPPEPLCLGDIPGEETEWLVPGLLPLSEVSLLGADGGTGKGIWQAQLIAYVTTGRTSPFFPEPPARTGRVLILAGEDDPGKVLKGRIAAAGADISRVMVVTADEYYLRTGRPLLIKDQALADFVDRLDPVLLILDPLQSFLGADVEMASRNQMRSALLPLKGLCTQHRMAALVAMHTNKKQGVSGRARLADSSDLWDIARSVLMMGSSKTDGKIYLSHEKSSYSKPARTILMHIEDDKAEGLQTARAVFDGTTDKKDADFLEERRLRLAQTRDDTTAAILNTLAESRLGSMASNELRAAVLNEAKCGQRTYERAYADLVKSGRITKKTIRQKDGKNRWYSYLDCGDSDGELQK